MAVPLIDPGVAIGSPAPPNPPDDGCSGHLNRIQSSDYPTEIYTPASGVLTPGPASSGAVSVAFDGAGQFGGVRVANPASSETLGFSYRLRVSIPGPLAGLLTEIPIGFEILDGTTPVTPTSVTFITALTPSGTPALAVKTSGDYRGVLGVAGAAALPSGTYDFVITATIAPRPSANLAALIVQFNEPQVQIYQSGWTLQWWSWGCRVASPSSVLTRVECLGTGDYRVDLTHRQTALTPRNDITTDVNLTVLSCDWSREPDTTTTATVTIEAHAGCADIIANLDPSIAEISIWRDEDPVWSGPIDDLDDSETGKLTFTASDVSGYVMPRRAVPRSWFTIDAAKVAADLILDALALDDPGDITVEWYPCGVKIDKVIDPADATTVGTVIGELAQSLIDWVVIDRTIVIGSRETPEFPQLDFPLLEDHFSDPPAVNVSRANMATRVTMKGATGIIGVAGGPRSDDGVLIDRIFEDSSITAVSDANRAAANILSVIREPIVTVDGSATSLRPDAPIDIQLLIPGVEVPVSLGRVIEYDGILAVGSVSVAYDGITENVSVSLTSATNGGLIE